MKSLTVKGKGKR